MAEPNDKINLANPTEVARETLRRLALRRIAPTPDNYQTLYEEIVGAPSAPAADPNAPSAATALSGLVLDLNRQYPELAVPVETLNQAIRKGDWTQCRKQLGQITLLEARLAQIEMDRRGMLQIGEDPFEERRPFVQGACLHQDRAQIGGDRRAVGIRGMGAPEIGDG